MNLYLLCSGLLVVLYALLSFYVSQTRVKRGKNIVDDVQLAKVVRAHGNAGEYVPLFVLLFLYFSSSASVLLLGAAILATVSRFSHVAGMLLARTANSSHPLRFAGALGTYLALLAFGLALLDRAGSFGGVA